MVIQYTHKLKKKNCVIITFRWPGNPSDSLNRNANGKNIKRDRFENKNTKLHNPNFKNNQIQNNKYKIWNYINLDVGTMYKRVIQPLDVITGRI